MTDRAFEECRTRRRGGRSAGPISARQPYPACAPTPSETLLRPNASVLPEPLRFKLMIAHLGGLQAKLLACFQSAIGRGARAGHGGRGERARHRPWRGGSTRSGSCRPHELTRPELGRMHIDHWLWSSGCARPREKTPWPCTVAPSVFHRAQADITCVLGLLLMPCALDIAVVSAVHTILPTTLVPVHAGLCCPAALVSAIAAR